MNLIGKIIGNRYEILKEVGNGGMATVYKAKDHVLNRFVAVKVLRDEYTTDSDFIKRFNTEAQSAASLQHPNIVSIYDVGHEEENNLYYIVMELIKGKTLKEIINKDGVLSWKWAVNIAIQIASALDVAHKNGIIHRDIKPHNIIITEDGVAKVTDFGIAKAVSNSTITAFGTTIGSVHYFSPEQAKGSITDAKSDLYSLGVVMYEMLTGKVPFDADTPVSVALKHMQEKPVQPIELNSEIPTAVNDIVNKAMQKDPLDRYQTAKEMFADLSTALKDPDGDFVIVSNKDGEYTRILNAIPDRDANSSKKTNKFKDYLSKHPKTKFVVVLLSLVLLFVVVFLVTKIALDGGIKKNVQIPDLKGKTQTEVEKTLNDLHLNMELGEEQYDDQIEAGKLISQVPPFENGKKIKEGSTVKVVFSKGPKTSDLPDFVGKTISEAKDLADGLGIEFEEKQENSDTVESGKIISQSIKAGTKVKSGDVVKLVISSGKEKVAMPTVVDMDEGTAKATLSNFKLKANVVYKNDDTKENGKVIEQSVEQGKEVEVGAIIEIIVNKIEKKTVELRVNVPSTSTLKEKKIVADEDNTYKLDVTVNGESIISNKTVKASQEVSCGSITGNKNDNKKVVVKVNDITVITSEFNMDDYENNGLVLLTK